MSSTLCTNISLELQITSMDIATLNIWFSVANTNQHQSTLIVLQPLGGN